MKLGLTKTEIFTEEQNQMAALAKVLGHPARIAIYQNLIQRDTCVCGDLVDDIGLTQPTISQHLKELKKIEIIKGTMEGTNFCYCIGGENWSRIKNSFLTFFNTNINCC